MAGASAPAFSYPASASTAAGNSFRFLISASARRPPGQLWFLPFIQTVYIPTP